MASEDQEIREAGFQIASRPSVGPAMWRRGRKVCSQVDALRISRREKPARDDAAELAELEAKKRWRK